MLTILQLTMRTTKMKVFKIDVDVAKPTLKVLNVPSTGEKYGIAVKASADGKRIASPSCRLMVGSDYREATKVLDDGSFLFEIEADEDLSDKKVMVHVVNMDEIPSGESSSQGTGIMIVFSIKYGQENNTDLFRISLMPGSNVMWFLKKNGAGYFADTEQITVTEEVEIGHNVTVMVGKRPKQEWKTFFVLPAGKYYPRELYRAVLGGSVGLPADCKVEVKVRTTPIATPDKVVEEEPDAVELDGVKYVPTTVTIGDVEYTILAAERDEVDSTDSDVIDSTDSTLTDGLIG